MSIKNQFNRQDVKYAMVALGIANIGVGNGAIAKLPQGALVIDVGLYTTTVFDSATTTTGTIDDGTRTFVDGQNLQAAGTAAPAIAKAYFPQGGVVNFSVAETGATAGVGEAIGFVGYLQLGNGGDDIYG